MILLTKGATYNEKSRVLLHGHCVALPRESDSPRITALASLISGPVVRFLA